ncbi:peptidase M61 [Croceicoccus sp. Ery5]|uniref:M61 family metallopeptidase n=1 Tax=Croceicoccus sp. Ery5 TaxID=1703340 RepID=UPI001E5F75DC|nr:peptidase M61 [Croceicoccus sp. Ery5]
MMNRSPLSFAAMLLACSLSLAALPATAQDAPDLHIHLSPAAPDAQGYIRSLDVAIRIEGLAPDAQVEMPVRRHTVPTSADMLSALAFSDAKGVLAVTAGDEGGDGDDANRARHWRPSRPVEGALTVAYRVTIDPAQPLFSLPQYELRTRNGVLSGAGLSFLMLPDDEIARDTDIDWHFAATDRARRGISSLGIGNVQSGRPQTAQDLQSSYFMAGTPHAWEKGTFFAAWDGDFAFDGKEIMGWAARLQDFYGDFFRQRPDHFGVFARVNETNPGSGIGLTDSFAFTFDDTMEPDALKGLLAHEMLHAWVNSLDGKMNEPDGFASSWFGEGLAVHYQRLLPFRAGLISRQDFLDDLNSTAGRYYTNVMIGTPNDDIGAGFWRDTRIRVLPYDRGSLYFAETDAAIRDASGGERSLDDIVREMLAERASGQPMDLALWERLLHRELGDAGIARFHAMLAGATVLPPSDAFGPCFRRTTQPMRRFDLGFDPASLLTQDRRVTGLKPGSNAEKAGLREGDRILNRFSQDGLQGRQDGVLDLEIERGSKHLSISYQPRGEEVTAYQWQTQPCPE